VSWITKILGFEGKELLEGVDIILSRFKGKPIGELEASEIKLEFERLLQTRDSEVEETIRTELGVKERILVAELTQGDNFTKRARPSVVYFGLLAIAVNYMLTPIVSLVAQAINEIPPDPISITLPVEFWVAWGGIVSTWVVGRSAEKRGTRNRLVSAVTGTPLTGGTLLSG
jgi:hypothetical protein